VVSRCELSNCQAIRCLSLVYWVQVILQGPSGTLYHAREAGKDANVLKPLGGVSTTVLLLLRPRPSEGFEGRFHKPARDGSITDCIAIG
jgi:hypothetical protein